MENHNPPVNMDGDMNKYVRHGSPSMNHVWPYSRHHYNQYPHYSHMYQESVSQQVQQATQPLQVQEMQQVPPQVQHSQVQHVQHVQQVQTQAQHVQQVQTQAQHVQQVQTQAQHVQQVQTQAQHVQQIQTQAQHVQQVQPQVQHVQQVQPVPQVQPAQTLPQVQQIQVQNSEAASTQHMTIVTNTLPNQSTMHLHDALTSRLNQNLNKVNATVTVPSTPIVSAQTPSVQQQKPPPEPQPTQILTRARMQDLVREVDPNEQLDEDVEEILLQMADDFVESAITAACLLAKHRKSPTVEVKDLQLHLERNWNMWIPGFGTDELRPYKRSSVNDAHKQRLTLIRKTLKKY